MIKKGGCALKLYFKTSNLGYTLPTLDGCNYDVGDDVDRASNSNGPGGNYFFNLDDSENFDEDKK